MGKFLKSVRGVSLLEGALLDFLKNQIKAIPSGPTSLIRNEESVGFYVQTNVSREKGGAKEASQLIKYDSVLREISKLLDRKIVHKDEIDDKEKASYILSILTNLPFATGAQNMDKLPCRLLSTRLISCQK